MDIDARGDLERGRWGESPGGVRKPLLYPLSYEGQPAASAGDPAG
jgi:hypothetical protein